MGSMVAIIPARGGSKGILHKNVIDFCGKPLIAWSIEQALNASMIDSVWVTSDDPYILQIAEQYGAKTILRPMSLSGDSASSESAWIHALDMIEERGVTVDVVIGIQATSPVRESIDFDNALNMYRDQQLDSLFTGTPLPCFFIWERGGGSLNSVNYDYRERKPRQMLDAQYVENGSFYLFKPSGIRESQNRLNGKMGIYEMPRWKSFEIDDEADYQFLKIVMQAYLLKNIQNALS